MAGTTIISVPAGTQSPVQFMTPLHNLCAAPQVLGGTVVVETAASPNGPWLAWNAGSSSSADSYRPPVNQYVRITAATQAAIAVITDMGGSNQPTVDQLVSANFSIASPSSTAIQKLFSVRIPPLFLPANFKCIVQGSVNLTNNANVKTLTLTLNGTGGTSFFTSPSLASNANYNFIGSFVGQGASSLKGVGAGATGGLGLSTTAFTTLTYDYINNETEICVCATKATGTDTFSLESLVITIF